MDSKYGTVSANIPLLFEKASQNVGDYLAEAINAIDNKFGHGYAKQNPVLVGAFIQACAQDFHTRMMKLAAQEIGDGLSNLNGIALATETVASAISSAK